MLKNVARLSEIFDDPETRTVPLSKREPITKLLEKELSEIIDIIRPDFFLEVGAFEAEFSQRMKKKYPEVPAVAVEANPRVYAHFCQTVKSSGVEYVNYAATSKKETVDIHIPEIIAGKEMPAIGRMGSLLEVGLRDSSTTSASVQGLPVDDLVGDRDFCNGCMWVDVEGFLKEVLDGAFQTISRCDIIYTEMEISPVWKSQTLAPDNIARLENLGFDLVARDCQKWFQFNALFLRRRIYNRDEVAQRIANFTQAAEKQFIGS